MHKKELEMIRDWTAPTEFLRPLRGQSEWVLNWDFLEFASPLFASRGGVFSKPVVCDKAEIVVYPEALRIKTEAGVISLPNDPVCFAMLLEVMEEAEKVRDKECYAERVSYYEYCKKNGYKGVK